MRPYHRKTLTWCGERSLEAASDGPTGTYPSNQKEMHCFASLGSHVLFGHCTNVHDMHGQALHWSSRLIIRSTTWIVYLPGQQPSKTVGNNIFFLSNTPYKLFFLIIINPQNLWSQFQHSQTPPFSIISQCLWWDVRHVHHFAIICPYAGNAVETPSD